ncbi:hypothetical protein F5883DRAFT_405812 [Diaporthe sp. PMI_573]|nr:hypothetical protein F5883DRAFT_405812 [Diaporthaceae sp. PMI_573]
MRDFTEYLQEAFITASGGNTYDNSYSNLDLTSRSLLHFPTPTGSRITLSSFVRPKFGTSYSIGIKDGWVSYLYSTLPTDATTSSDRIPLPNLLRSYRSLSTNAARHTVGHGLVYGRLYLPQNRLEALLAARVTPEVNLTLRAVSQETLHHGGTALALASWDDPAGRFGLETLASSDGGVLGLRGLWNATNPPLRSNTSEMTPAAVATNGSSNHNNNADRERVNGRFSVGGEIYYGLLNKSGGLSLGGRFQTLPTHAGTPLTAALTFNLLGHFSATYAVMAGRGCTLASQFGFNIYSYESDWALGVELWRGGRARKEGGAVTPSEPATAAAAWPTAHPPPKQRSFQAKLEWRLDGDDNKNTPEEEYDPSTGAKLTTTGELGEDSPAGVVKCRCDQHMRVGLMYEGRYKSLLFSLGTDVDLRRLDAPFQGVGLAVQFSS